MVEVVGVFLSLFCRLICFVVVVVRMLSVHVQYPFFWLFLFPHIHVCFHSFSFNVGGGEKKKERVDVLGLSRKHTFISLFRTKKKNTSAADILALRSSSDNKKSFSVSDWKWVNGDEDSLYEHNLNYQRNDLDDEDNCSQASSELLHV